jgi:putative YhdH/YhfP family quinone oxidoreductase
MTSETFRAFTSAAAEGRPDRGVGTTGRNDLPDDGVLVAVEWSSVNYKDALATLPEGRVARIAPLIPGIDLAGVVLESSAEGIAPGQSVIAHGYDLGVSHHGGFAELASVPAGWVVPLPDGLELRDAMVVGTAGYTAALSVLALEAHGLTPDAGPVLVTGATGGVGSLAVAMLAARGYRVSASTGKADAGSYLGDLGATEIVERSELDAPGGKPMEKPRWAGAVDCVGGATLANVVKRLQYGGAVAASGNTGGVDLATNVFPFILRGVSLLGIDSVQTPLARRREVWGRIATDLRPRDLAAIGHEVTLDQLDEALVNVHEGRSRGRAVVNVRA